jgi:hypothetical protein
MGVSVESTTIRGVIEWFEEQKTYNYTIYRGVKLDFVSDCYDGNDRDEAESKLKKFCEKIEPTNDNIYYLKLDSKGKIKENLPGHIFRLNVEAPKFNSYYQQQQFTPVNDNNEILSRLAAIENSLQQPDEEPDEEPDEDNIIGSLLKEPGIKNMLISGIGSILANLLTPVTPAPIALAGINEKTETEILQDCIKTLFSKGVTINDLVTLSEKSENELNLLLSILRK